MFYRLRIKINVKNIRNTKKLSNFVRAKHSFNAFKIDYTHTILVL